MCKPDDFASLAAQALVQKVLRQHTCADVAANRLTKRMGEANSALNQIELDLPAEQQRFQKSGRRSCIRACLLQMQSCLRLLRTWLLLLKEQLVSKEM